MFSKLPIDPVFGIIRHVLSSIRQQAPIGWGSHDWRQFTKARLDNNPQYALILSWGILEKEAQRSFSGLPKIEGKNPAIVKNSKRVLNLSNEKHGSLQNAMRKRNRAAHGEKVHVDWSDVDIVIDVAYRLHQLR